ncbi:MAG: response regulator [Ramlibacter sp.]|nr:response regulator [Ramlibacter sp.]
MGDKPRLLLIDDDAATVSYLEAKLGRYYDLLGTTLPEMAVPLALHMRPDVILCDIDMPGMTGGDVAAALAADEQTAGIPLIYLTALVTPEETQELNGYISGRPGVSKRAPLAELMRRIAAATGRAASEHPFQQQHAKEAEGGDQRPFERDQAPVPVAFVPGGGIEGERHAGRNQQQHDGPAEQQHGYQALAGWAKPAGACRSSANVMTS